MISWWLSVADDMLPWLQVILGCEMNACNVDVEDEITRTRLDAGNVDVEDGNQTDTDFVLTSMTPSQVGRTFDQDGDGRGNRDAKKGKVEVATRESRLIPVVGSSGLWTKPTRTTRFSGSPSTSAMPKSLRTESTLRADSFNVDRSTTVSDARPRGLDWETHPVTGT
jgi:hypothetical protein